jgi:exopolysaccharide biosynthesis protein
VAPSDVRSLHRRAAENAHHCDGGTSRNASLSGECLRGRSSMRSTCKVDVTNEATAVASPVRQQCNYTSARRSIHAP